MSETFNGKECKIEIKVLKSLYYTAKIIDFDKNMIRFTDRENKMYAYPVQDIKEVSEI